MSRRERVAPKTRDIKTKSRTKPFSNQRRHDQNDKRNQERPNQKQQNANGNRPSFKKETARTEAHSNQQGQAELPRNNQNKTITTIVLNHKETIVIMIEEINNVIAILTMMALARKTATKR